MYLMVLKNESIHYEEGELLRYFIYVTQIIMIIIIIIGNVIFKLFVASFLDRTSLLNDMKFYIP